MNHIMNWGNATQDRYRVPSTKGTNELHTFYCKALKGGVGMIYITGDTHGDINRFCETGMPGESSWTSDDYLIICGDFGFIFADDDKEKELLDTLEKKPYHILFVDGNHENFTALFQYPEERWNGGKIHRIRENIFHLMRGQVFTIDGKQIFTFGGAYSIDRYMRVKDESFWDAEIPNKDEYHEAVKSLNENDNNVDFVITHTAPRETIRKMGYYPDVHDTELTGFLEWIMYECKYQKWYFGHWHEDVEIDAKHRALLFDVCRAD